MLTNEAIRQADVNSRILEQLKLKREEHAALTLAEQQNLQLSKEQHKAQVMLDERRIKAALDNLAGAKVQADLIRIEQEEKGKELAAWQRRNESKELALQELERGLQNQGVETKDKLKKLRAELESRVVMLRGNMEKINELIDETALVIQLL